MPSHPAWCWSWPPSTFPSRATACTWSSAHCSQSIHYGPGLCPVAEQLHTQTFIGLALGQVAHGPEQIGLIVAAFRKVIG